MWLGCLPLIFAIALLWGGGQGLYTALTNTKPTVLGYDEYVRTKPRATWIELKDCVLVLPEASFRSSRVSKEITEVFIPVRSGTSKEEEEEKIHVLVATKDQETLGLMKEAHQAQDDTAAALKLLSSKADKMFPKKDVKGLVRYGIELRDKERRQLASLDENLAADFIIIDEGKKPEPVVSTLMFLGGLICLWLFGRARASTPPAAPPPPPAVPPTPPPAVPPTPPPAAPPPLPGS